MVKLKTAIIALLAAGSIATASDSGVYSFRAQRSLDKGKFAKGYNQLERALLASRKEADLLSEGRVLVAMAQIRTMSLDLNFADSLLSVVRKDVLDQGTLLQYTKVKISLLNAQEKYREATKICSAYDEKALKKNEETAQAAFYGECAIAYAAVRSDRAPDALKMTGKRSERRADSTPSSLPAWQTFLEAAKPIPFTAAPKKKPSRPTSPTTRQPFFITALN